MQNLLIDIGNTRLKWAVEDNGLFKRGEDVVLSQISINELVDQFWQELVPDHIMISCVANKTLEKEIIDTISSSWDRAPSVLKSSASDLGITNSYSQPEKLGSDRWAAMVAAYDLAKDAVCVVDCGSAVTLDVVDLTGKHLGGLIVPGVALAQQSLLQGTSLYFETGNEFSASELLGQSTEQCIQRGSLEQVCGLINRVFNQLKKEHASLQLVLTGGDAEMVMSRLSMDAVIDSDLVLKGLAKILRSQILAYT